MFGGKQALDSEKLLSAINDYKKIFPVRKADEKYKWQAVKHFQDKWNIDAPDFRQMFEQATKLCGNLLASYNFYPRGMMCEIAQQDSEFARSLFKELFDESKDLAARVDKFDKQAKEFCKIHFPGKQSYQNANAISTYLWLRYPDKYYIYKYTEAKQVEKKLCNESFLTGKKGAYRLAAAFEKYDLIRNALSADKEYTAMLKEFLTPDCYQDENFCTATIDFVYLLDKNFAHDPWEYTAVISKEEWCKLLHDKDIFSEHALIVLRRLYEMGGTATCTQLAEKYGETPNYYNRNASACAQKVVEKTGCPQPKNEDGNSKWWPVLFVGKYADKNTPGSYSWTLRKELKEAMEECGIVSKQNMPRYWWLNSNPKIWSVSSLEVEKEQSYSLVNDNGNKRRIYANFLAVQPGDPVICYETTPIKSIVGLGVITHSSDGKNISFKKTQTLLTPIPFTDLRDCEELQNMEFFINGNGSLFMLTKDEYDFIMDMIQERNQLRFNTSAEKYTYEDFAADRVFISDEQLKDLTALMASKRNIILQGAPGVGKTYIAKRLAWLKMGEKDNSRIRTVQFHQNYSYEDFVIGYKPNGDKFELTCGIFYNFCKMAEGEPNKEFFFIIDEINRGNLSKIFGELLMLIEETHRGEKIVLSQNGAEFCVPKNLYIIGMMNTADRSLAIIDYALRRRFAFFDMRPGFDCKAFKEYCSSLANPLFDKLISGIKSLNEAIEKDDALGEGFCIGHSYFSCLEGEDIKSRLHIVVKYEILPMLKEYWFDDRQKYLDWESALTKILEE